MQYIARQPQAACNMNAALSNLKTLMEKELDRIDTLATAVHESKDKMKVSDIYQPPSCPWITKPTVSTGYRR
jgi:hypothetical protein